ncbi:MAG: PAS domain S-box protein [Eubacterium sp.]|nr:PAS domain S-box protein [Eubacterium sp.]
MSDKIAFDHLLENTTDGFFVVGYDGHIRMENSLAAEILDIEEENLFGKTLVNLISESGQNDDFYECILDAVYKKERIARIVPFYKNGQSVQLKLIVSPLRDRKDDIAAIVMFSDITELSELGSRNEMLMKKLVEFVDRFVRFMINAIDERSHYNANHTRSMVTYAENYMNYLSREGRAIDQKKRGPFLSSVWMHDVGKLVIPLNIMDKPTRLGDKEKDVKHRIEVAILCEKLRIAESKAETVSEIERAKNIPGTPVTLSTEVKPAKTDNSSEMGIGDLRKQASERIAKLEEARDFILDANTRGYMDKDSRDKVMEYADIPCLTPSGETVPLLDEYERKALTIERGTLTDEEREIMQSHVIKTHEMLQQMEFEGPYKDVPEWAGRHHEFLDGSGYPNGIHGDEITWETRILTIIDIYDALTAEDRPYKPPLSPQKAFDILKDMAVKGKIDSEILDDFIKSEAWKQNM